MSRDPEQVARAILLVQQALEHWQAAAIDAAAAAREEHKATSAVVEQSARSAMQARIGAEDLGAELVRLGSALENARGGVMAAAAAVQERSRKHQELADHVQRTHEAWSGHLEGARRDHLVAGEQRAAAEQAAATTGARLQAAQARVQRVRRNAERAAALAELRQAQEWHRYCSTRRDQAVMWEQEQGARVQRCTRALGLAQEAGAELQGAATDLSSATRAVAAAQAQLAYVEGAMQTAHAHLARMTQSGEEAISHAGRASQGLTSVTHHLYEVEDWQQRGHLLAMDAGYEMAEAIQELRRIDAPMGGGGGSEGAPPATPGPNRPPSKVPDRIEAIKGNMTAGEKARTTFAVAQMVGPDGSATYWVSSAGSVGYVPPRIRGDMEVIANKVPEGNAENRLNDGEQTLLREAHERGFVVVSIGATRDVCVRCQEVLDAAGLGHTIVTPRRSN